MITLISCILDQAEQDVRFVKVHDYKYEIDTSAITRQAFSLKIIFDQPIVAFRAHDYTWKQIKVGLVATEMAPKIIKFANDTFIQANQHSGIWEVHQKSPNTLYWHFNPPSSKPIISYRGTSNLKTIRQAQSTQKLPLPLSLLVSNSFALEVSRSKFPFSAIACFTDHCDFDSLENIQIQRQFFNKHAIKITKGFFLNHFSKRDFNASIERHKDEFEAWQNDGHELAYHSLTQSLKSETENLNDFKNFTPPFEGVRTWIDHGFQPYNFSLYTAKGISHSDYEQTLLEKQITILWNYLDSGTSTYGVINQLNPEHFTLKTYLKGTQHFGFKDRLKLNIKNVLMHFFNSEKHQKLYITLASDYKNVYSKSLLKRSISLFKNGMTLGLQLLSVIVFWKVKGKQTYPLAAYTPFVFRHRIFEHEFYVFQTLEMVDFKAALCKSNLDILIKESGIFIAHTYFSVPLAYHKGKLFDTPTTIDTTVDSHFAYLSTQIKDKHIWNPTLKELVSQLKQLETITFDCSETGIVSIHNAGNLIYRQIT